MMMNPTLNSADSGFIFAGHFDEPDTYVIKRPQGMSDWLICYTIEGEGYFRTPEGDKRCLAGDVALLRSGIPHQYGTIKEKRWHFYWAHFQGLQEASFLSQQEVWVQTVSSEYYRRRIHRAFRNLLHDSRERSGMWESLCHNAIREVLLLSYESQNTKLDSRVQSTLHLLTQRMTDEIKIGDLAKAVALSPSRLSHLFKQEMGEPIIEYLNRMRINQAALLIGHTDRTASEAALDVGFTNYNHFAKLFRKQFNMSPRSYRMFIQSQP